MNKNGTHCPSPGPAKSPGRIDRRGVSLPKSAFRAGLVHRDLPTFRATTSYAQHPFQALSTGPLTEARFLLNEQIMPATDLMRP